MRCEHCGNENKDGFRVCLSCKAKLPEPTASEEALSDKKLTDATEKKPSCGEFLKKQQRTLTRLGIVVTAAILAVLVFFILFNNTNEIDYTKHPVVYSKNNELYLRSYGKKESYKIADSTEGDIHVSEKGDLIFFCDNYTDSQFTLYYRKTDEKTPNGKNADSKGVKISDNVNDYQISDNGRKALYTKNGELYLYDLKASYYIAGNVTAYRFSKDNAKLLYIADRSLYVRELGKKDSPEHIASDVDALFTRDQNMLYFKKDNALYFAKEDSTATMVLDDIHTIFSPKENIYFAVTRTKAEDETVTYAVYKLDGYSCTESVSQLSEAPASDRVITRTGENGTEQMILKLDGSVVPIDQSFNISNITVSYDDKYIYCINEPNADGKGAFTRYELSDTGISSPTHICDNVASIAVHGKADEIITAEGDSFGIWSDGEYTQVSAGSVRLMYVDVKNKELYYIDNLKDNSGTLKKLKNGKVTEIDTEVSDFVFRGKNCYYVKNGDLYYKKGNKSATFVDSDIDSILYKYIYIKEGVY